LVKRTSNVQLINTVSAINASFINIGDTHEACPETRAIALQKEGETFQGELEFEDYSIFSQKKNLPKTKPKVIKHTINHQPNIYVQNVNVIALSSSSIMQVGNLNHISAESRILHIRYVIAED